MSGAGSEKEVELCSIVSANTQSVKRHDPATLRRRATHGPAAPQPWRRRRRPYAGDTAVAPTLVPPPHLCRWCRLRRPYARGAAVVDLTTKRGFTKAPGFPFPFAEPSSKVSMHNRPTSSKSWPTVVNGGMKYAASGWSS